MRAKKIAGQKLTGDELAAVKEMLSNLDTVRKLRNRVLYDVWAKKGIDDQRLFAMHANLYLSFVTEFASVHGSVGPDGAKAKSAIEVANDFAEKATNGFTLDDLEGIRRQVDDVSMKIMTMMLARIAM